MIPVPKDRLSSLAAGIADAIARSEDPRRIAFEVKALVADALRWRELVLDCLEAAVSAIEAWDGTSTWDNPPIVDDEDREFSVRLIYWPAGSGNRPHRHTYWTVTGVLFNELSFRTFTEPSTAREPPAGEREFLGHSGDVGAIVPPCIHQVWNPSSEASISLHVFSGPRAGSTDANRFERGSTFWFDGARARDEGIERTAPAIFEALTASLISIDDPRSVLVLDRLVATAAMEAKLDIVKAIARREPSRAVSPLRRLADQCPGEDRLRLHALADRIRSAAG